MSDNTIDFFHSELGGEQMNFLYAGDFNDEHTDHFIELNNHQFEVGDQLKRLQRRAAFLIAECFQNLSLIHI